MQEQSEMESETSAVGPITTRATTTVGIQQDENDEAEGTRKAKATASSARAVAWSASPHATAVCRKSLLEIMAEEQQQQRGSLAAPPLVRHSGEEEDEAALRLALEASLRLTKNDVSDATRMNKMTRLEQEEEEQIRLAIQLSMGAAEELSSSSSSPAVAPAVASLPTPFVVDDNDAATALSPQEMAAIQKALQDAEDEEARESFLVALELQSQEDFKRHSGAASVGSSLLRNKGNVRTVTHAEYLKEAYGSMESRKLPAAATAAHGGGGVDDDPYFHEEAGFRINSSKPSAQWCRVDQGAIIGPNGEVRTKHDVRLHGQANAHRLNLDLYEESASTVVGNKAFNEFLRKDATK